MNHERSSLIARGPTHTVLALALVHHLAITNNLPFAMIAEFFAGLGHHLIIEFVPKEDSQARGLLFLRPEQFPDYNQAAFEFHFAQRFEILDRARIPDSERTLFVMRRRDGIRG